MYMNLFRIIPVRYHARKLIILGTVPAGEFLGPSMEDNVQHVRGNREQPWDYHNLEVGR